MAASSEETGYFRKFCKETTLDGWRNLFIPNPIWRVLWFVVIASAIVWSAYDVYVVTLQYVTSTTITTIASTMAPLDDITFPSVYICNVNQVSRVFLESGGANDSRSANLVFGQFMDGWAEGGGEPLSEEDNQTLTQIYSTLKSSYADVGKLPFISVASQNCSEMIIEIEHPSTKTSRKFYKSIENDVTDYGYCCNINAYLNFINPATVKKDSSNYSGQDYLSVPTGSTNGIRGGVILTLDTEAFDYAYNARASSGFRIALVDPRDKPIMNQNSILISPGTETLVAITPSVVTTTSAAISRFRPVDRDCYDPSEFKLSKIPEEDGFRYSISNCLYSSVLDRVIDNCSCVPHFYSNYHFKDIKELPQCMGIQLSCANYWLDLMGDPHVYSAQDTDGTTKECLLSCNFQSESFSVTSSAYPNEALFPVKTDACVILQKMARLCSKPFGRSVFEATHNDNKTNVSCDDILKFNNTDKVCDADDILRTEVLTNDNDVVSIRRLVKFLYNYARE